ncbi:MAG: hypothetical protein DDT19_01738 [Syntrophomonadaceae bacterium]|nr:hypothetical protein [Bacillota bacterium]
MIILPKIRTAFGQNIGVTLFITPPDLGENERTFLATDAAPSTTTFTVDNGLKFAANEFLVFGIPGTEKSEILRITSVTATSIVTGASSFAHNRGESITFIPYNQVIIQRSTNAGVTYSNLITIDLRVDSTETVHVHTTGTSTDFYRIRFFNSISLLESQTSDGIIATGFAAGSVGTIVREALISLGEQIDSIITKEFLYSALNEGRADLDQHPAAGKWSFRTAFDHDAGDCIPGRYTLTLPLNLRRDDTYENILSVRLGKDKLPLQKVDKLQLNGWYLGVAHSTLNGAITPLSTSIVLTSSGDFDASGSVDIAAETIAGTVDNALYTTNTKTTATLGTVTSIANSHATGRDVWQGASFGEPIAYTVNDGRIIFSQPFGDDLRGENVHIDYYTELTTVNSDGDLLDEPNPKIYIPYLRWRIKKRRNKELNEENDSDYKKWIFDRDGMVAKEFLGQNLRFSVDIPG